MSLFADYRERPAHVFTNYCNRAGAALIKQKIENYWLARGYLVKVTLQGEGFTPSLRGARVDVRSDLVNGLPVKKLGGRR